MIDFWQLARDFRVGDTVQGINLSNSALSPYVGRVVQVSPGIGMVDVQWPFGVEQASPETLVRVSPTFFSYVPPELNQLYPELKSKRASDLWSSVLPKSFYVHLAKSWHKGASALVAYDDYYRSHPLADEPTVRAETDKFYRLGSRAFEMRLEAAVVKTAAYWVAQNRQYRATSDDLNTGKPACPKCATRMRKTTYRMEAGAKHKVLACPKCLEIIDPGSVLGPSGEPHDWFGTGGI